jgi:hypothetical protein
MLHSNHVDSVEVIADADTGCLELARYLTNEGSSLIALTANLAMYSGQENPVPKSSSARLTPAFANSPSAFGAAIAHRQSLSYFNFKWCRRDAIFVRGLQNIANKVLAKMIRTKG